MAQIEQAVILSAVRTPIGKFMGGLAPLSATELGAKVVAEVGAPRGHRAEADGRSASWATWCRRGWGRIRRGRRRCGGGLDPRVAAMTINKVCGSGLKAVALAAQAVALGESEIVVAGGMESMSNCPYLLKGARTGYRLGNQEIFDSMIIDGLWDVYENFHMGMTGELVAEKYGISRQEQDQFALESHQKAVRAIKSCFFERADRAGGDSAEEGRARDLQDGRIAARGYFARSAREAEARVQEGRHGDRGQRAGNE